MDNNNNIPRDPLSEYRAWENRQKQPLIPFTPTAMAEDVGSKNPYFIDPNKEVQQREYERQVRAGQISATYFGNDQYGILNNPNIDPDVVGEAGIKQTIKYEGSMGWGEANTRKRDAFLNWADGKSATFNWDLANPDSPSNFDNETSYWGAMGEGIGKWFVEMEADTRYQKMLEDIERQDPNFTQAESIRMTQEFIDNNKDVARYAETAGVNLFDYTKNAANPLGLRFRIHEAIKDATQNIRLGRWNNDTNGFTKMWDSLYFGVQDPMLARDIAVTTALTLGLGTIEVGAARLGLALGQASTAGARAMSVARAAGKALQFTSPFTGLAEGIAYRGIQAAVPSVGKAGLATTLARTTAIAMEASTQSVLAAYADQRNQYEWRSLMFKDQDAAFKPDWQQLGIQAAIAAGMGTAAMGVLRFGLGAIGDVAVARKLGWEGYKKHVAGSLDTWARTKDGLTVWGDRLSQGRGIVLGDVIDNYMARNVDQRNLASILVNGQRLLSRAVFSPQVAAKVNFNTEGATKVADTFAEALGLPGEYVQGLKPTSVERLLFDNLMDPEYLELAGLTYDDVSKILNDFKRVQDKVIGPTEVADVITTKAIAEAVGDKKLAEKLGVEPKLLALADIFDMDLVNKQLQRAGVSFEQVNTSFKNLYGRDIDFGNSVDRQAFRTLGRFNANSEQWSSRVVNVFKFMNQFNRNGLKLGDSEISADTMRVSIRNAFDFDAKIKDKDGNTKQRIFITDASPGLAPTAIIEIDAQGSYRRWDVRPEIENGKVVLKSQAFDQPDYVPENIFGVDDVESSFSKFTDKLKAELEKVDAESKKGVDAELEENLPPEVFAQLGKLPTKQVLMNNFGLTGNEATVAAIVMDTLGMDIKKVVLKVIRASGTQLKNLQANKAVGMIQWQDIKSGVAALLSTAKGADFGTLVHEMGHYNRMLFIGDSPEHVALRNSLGITDDVWAKFTNWLGYDGPWENDISKMSAEQIKAEEKFANAWSYYLRSIMFGTGKTNESSLHRMFSAFGDHLGELGKKMQTQDKLDASIGFDEFSKAVYDKLFLRSEGRVTEFWELAVKDVFKGLPEADRERLGETIMGTELWNSHKAKVKAASAEARAATAGLTPSVKRISKADLAKSLKAKMSGESLQPSQKAIRDGLKAGKTIDEIEAEVRELFAKVTAEEQVWDDSPLRPVSALYFSSHVEKLSDEQVQALPVGKRLQPINTVVRLVYKPDTKKMDVTFPVVVVTEKAIKKELLSRKQRRLAFQRLRETQNKKVATDPVVQATAVERPVSADATPDNPEPTVVDIVVTAKESIKVGVTEKDGTPVLDVTQEERIVHEEMRVTEQAVESSAVEIKKTTAESALGIVQLTDVDNDGAVVAQAITVRDAVQSTAEQVLQEIPQEVQEAAVAVAEIAAATKVPPTALIKEILGDQNISPIVLEKMSRFVLLDSVWRSVSSALDAAETITFKEAEDFAKLDPTVVSKLEEAIGSPETAVPEEVARLTGVSEADARIYVTYMSKRNKAAKKLEMLRMQKQANENEAAYLEYEELLKVENPTEDQLKRMKSLWSKHGEYVSAAEKLGKLDLLDEVAVEKKKDEQFITYIMQKRAEKAKITNLAVRPKAGEILDDEDFLLRLISNPNWNKKFRPIVNAANRSDPIKGHIVVNEIVGEEVFSDIFRSEEGVIGFFKKNLNLPEATPDELFNAVIDWGNDTLESSRLKNDLLKRAKRKAGLKGTGSGKTVTGEATKEGEVGIFSRTESRDVSNSVKNLTEAISSLFADYLDGEEFTFADKSKLSQRDYFIVRKQTASEATGGVDETIEKIKLQTGIQLTENIITRRDEQIEKAATRFFADILNDPELSKPAQQIIEIRFGIKKKPKTKKRSALLQSPLEDSIGEDLRTKLLGRELKTAKDVLKFVADSNSELSNLAKFLQRFESGLESIPLYVADADIKFRGYRSRPVSRKFFDRTTKALQSSRGTYYAKYSTILLNDANTIGAENTVVALHEIIHAIVVKDIEGRYNGRASGDAYLKELSRLTLQDGVSGTPLEKLVDAYLDMVYNTLPPETRNLINSTEDAFVQAALKNMDAPYGLYNLQEFIAEALTNKEFTETLALTGSDNIRTKLYEQILDITPRKTPSSQVTMLDVFMEAVEGVLEDASGLSFLRFDSNSVAEFKAKKTALSLVLNSAIDSARREYKRSTSLYQEQTKAVNDLKAAKGRLQAGLRQNALYQSWIDDLMDTPEFREWWGNSWATEASSVLKPSTSKRPMMFYHGTPTSGFAAFKTPDFSTSRPDLLYGAGVYVTESTELANSYTGKDKHILYVTDSDGTELRYNIFSNNGKINTRDLSKVVDGLIDGNEDIVNTIKRELDNPEDVPIAISGIKGIVENWIRTQGDLFNITNKQFWKELNNDILDLVTEFMTMNWDEVGDMFEIEVVPTKAFAEALGFEKYGPEVGGKGVYPVMVSIQNPIDMDNTRLSKAALVEAANKLGFTDLAKVLKGMSPGELDAKTSQKPLLSLSDYLQKLAEIDRDGYEILKTAIDWLMDNPSGLNREGTVVEDVVFFLGSLLKTNKDAELSFVQLTTNLSKIASVAYLEMLNSGRMTMDEYSFVKKRFYKVLNIEVLDKYVDTDFRPAERFFKEAKEAKLEHQLIQTWIKMGYDGITHIGGIATGRDIKHRVFISWDPGKQLASQYRKTNWKNRSGLLQKPVDIDALVDAVDLRRRKLKEYGLDEEMTPEELESIQRILKGLDPVEISQVSIFDRVGQTFTPSGKLKISSLYDGSDYRSLSDNERRDFILNTVIPKIKLAMGDRNSTAGLFSAFSSGDMGRKVNSLIGGAVAYGDTADSGSILAQFIAKIFDPMMDLRDGELKNKFDMPNLDKVNAERNNIMFRIGLTKFTKKIEGTVKNPTDAKNINDMAWLYATRVEELPKDIPHRDLVLEAIQLVNDFNKIRVELLSSFGKLSKGVDPTKYGTSHRANKFAEVNQTAFVDAMTDVFVKRTRESNQLSIITAAALGWVDLKRNTATDDITAIRIAETSPLAKLLPDQKRLGKWEDWSGDTRKALSDATKLDPETRKIHDKGLVSTDDYTDTWRKSYPDTTDRPYTALRQAAEIAKNRYLGIDMGDSKASSPRRQSIGEGRNYTEERIFTHDEIVKDEKLNKFFRNDVFGLLQDDLNTQILDVTMTRELTKFFGTRMSMTDLLEILSTTGEEMLGRQHLSASEIESRVRGYNRLRNSWERAIGVWSSDRDSLDVWYRTLLDNARIPLTAASGLRAAVTSLPELSRALLTSNKNKPMLMQFFPNMIKLVRSIGPGGKKRRQARYQMLSAAHWLRGLATDHMLHRDSLNPDNPFTGTVFGENAGGMFSNFINGWRAAGEANKHEINWLQRVMNRLQPISSAIGAPLVFVNDCSTLLHLWNAQENITTNLDAFRRMADMLEKNPTTDMAKFAKMAKQCGLAPQEAVNLSTSGLLKTKYIDILGDAAKNQTLYSDGILDSSKMYTWAGEDQDKLDAIAMMGGYLNMTSRLTNVEPTLLDIRTNQSVYAKAFSQYMQFFLSMGVQEVGRRRRNTSTEYTKHLVGLLLMEIVAYGSSRALSDPSDEETGGIDEFEKNPMDYTVRTLAGLPLLGSYSWLGHAARHIFMGASELMGGPAAEQEFRLPDLMNGPASTAPRRLVNFPSTVGSYYTALEEMMGN